MTSARQPAFWRVVRTRDGVREYLIADDKTNANWAWSHNMGDALWWRTLDGADSVACARNARTVAVYHSVRKVQRGHDSLERKAVRK